MTIGFILLNCVLVIPALSDIFSVAYLNRMQLITVYALSLLCYPAIQLLKTIMCAFKKDKKPKTEPDKTDTESDIDADKENE